MVSQQRPFGVHRPSAGGRTPDDGQAARPVSDPTSDPSLLHRVSGAISVTMAFLAAGLVALLMVVITVDVVGRATIGVPFTGSVEIATNLVVAIAFLGMPYALHRGSHIRSTVVIDRAPAGLRTALTTVGHLVGIAAFAAVAWGSWSPAVRAFQAGEYEGEGALRVPTWPIRWLIIAVAAVMVIEGVNSLQRALAERRKAADA